MQQPPQKPITYFIVQPDQFQAVCNKLGTLPYMQVSELLANFVGTSRAMFDPLPTNAPPPGAPVPNDPGAGQETKPNGNGSAEPGATPAIETLPDEDGSAIVDPENLDDGDRGGAQ